MGLQMMRECCMDDGGFDFAECVVWCWCCGNWCLLSASPTCDNRLRTSWRLEDGKNEKLIQHDKCLSHIRMALNGRKIRIDKRAHTLHWCSQQQVARQGPSKVHTDEIVRFGHSVCSETERRPARGGRRTAFDCEAVHVGRQVGFAIAVILWVE